MVSGGLSDLLGKSSEWTVSSERLQARASHKRTVRNELEDLYRLQARRHQPSSQIAVKIDAQKKLLQVAEEQRNALVKNVIVCALVDIIVNIVLILMFEEHVIW